MRNASTGVSAGAGAAYGGLMSHYLSKGNVSSNGELPVTIGGAALGAGALGGLMHAYQRYLIKKHREIEMAKAKAGV